MSLKAKNLPTGKRKEYIEIHFKTTAITWYFSKGTLRYCRVFCLLSLIKSDAEDGVGLCLSWFPIAAEPLVTQGTHAVTMQISCPDL